MSQDKITFLTEEGEEQEFYVLERTKLNGIYYLLVSEQFEEEDTEVEVFILREDCSQKGGLLRYEVVEDELELSCVASLFEEEIE